jgi:hypothetical protein
MGNRQSGTTGILPVKYGANGAAPSQFSNRGRGMKNVKEKNAKGITDCSQYRPVREFSHFQEFIDNLPYVLMVLIGSVVVFLSWSGPQWRMIAALLYFAYGVAGAFWIILFVCPYCHFYETRSCPCGYGQIAARLVPSKDGSRFKEKFRKHIPVIVPLWILPAVAGVLCLVRGFSWGFLSLLLIFTMDSFVILPILSRQYGCAHCDQKDECPWMKSKV